jgi:DNA repair exonuclease SbcCD ATPase subunit
MRNYIQLKGIQDVNWDDIDAIDNQINANLNFDQYTKYKTYKLKYLKWSNYLSYGPDNYFDFTKLHGLVLLNSEPANQGGKTTFAIDLMRFALFNKSEKCPELKYVFNSYNDEVTTVVVEAGLEIDGDDYVIRRTITRPTLKRRTKSSKPKQKAEYFKIVNGNYEVIENCEGESVKSTNNIIQEMIGSVDDFNLVVSANSYSLNSLLKMGPTAKGDLFSRWLGLLSIKEKEGITKKIWKDNYEKNLLLNIYNKEVLNTEIENCNNYISQCNEEIIVLNKQLLECSNNIDKYNKIKEEKLSGLKTIINNLDSVDVTTLDNEIKYYQAELLNKEGRRASLLQEYSSIKDVKYDENEYIRLRVEKEKVGKEIQGFNNIATELRTTIRLKQDQIKYIESLMSQGICPTCKQPINAIELTEQKNTLESEIKNLINQGIENKKEINKLNQKLDSINVYREQLKKNQETENKANKILLEGYALRDNIKEINAEIEKREKIKADIKQNEENLKINAEIRASVLTIEGSIKNETTIKENYIREIESKKTLIEQNTNEINKRQDIIAKLDKEAILKRNWDVYQELVGKNGITKMVLKEALPIINGEVARLLNGLCDFEVELALDESNTVMVNLIRDGVIMDLGVAASGFEGTIASLALRSALGNISSMPKPSLLCVDEVLGPIAVSNMENMHELYKRIVMNYDFIINITHNELIYDWHNQIITVTKENNISKINFQS